MYIVKRRLILTLCYPLSFDFTNPVLRFLKASNIKAYVHTIYRTVVNFFKYECQLSFYTRFHFRFRPNPPLKLLCNLLL